MRRLWAFVIVAMTVALQEAVAILSFDWGFRPNLVAIFLAYCIFYRFKYSEYLVIITGFLLGVHSPQNFVGLMVAMLLWWVVLEIWLKYVLKKTSLFPKLIFLVFSSFVITPLTAMVFLIIKGGWVFSKNTWIANGLATLLIGVLLWWLLDRLKNKYWIDENLSVKV